MMALRGYRFLSYLFIMLLFPSLLRAAEPDGVPGPLLFGVALDGFPITEERLRNVEKDIGLSPGIVVFFFQWPSIDGQEAAPFPRESLDAIWNMGAIPCLTWEPMYHRDGHEVMVPFDAILNGDYDPYILGFARQSAMWKKPFMIRFAHEMNVERYHWGTKKKGYGPESPGIYKRLFRYMVTMFQKADAQNVLWVFCPNAESVPNTSYDPRAYWNRVENYYPGEKYVDVLGIDGYNWGTTQTKAKHGWESQWKEFGAIFDATYQKLREVAPGKPIFIFETASVSQGGDKCLWIKQAFDTAAEWKVNGLIWFQAKKECDWRINSRGKTSCVNMVKAPRSFSHQWIRSFQNDQRRAD